MFAELWIPTFNPETSRINLKVDILYIILLLVINCAPWTSTFLFISNPNIPIYPHNFLFNEIVSKIPHLASVSKYIYAVLFLGDVILVSMAAIIFYFLGIIFFTLSSVYIGKGIMISFLIAFF